MGTPNKRPLGKTGLEVTELGLGTWPLSVLEEGKVSYSGTPEKEALAILDTYVERGGNFIDTALIYNGVETIIGKYLKQMGQRDRVLIASKSFAGYTPETHAEIEGHIEADLNTSLQDLGTDYLDLFFLHQPPSEPDLMERALAKMTSLKQSGKIRTVGASIKGPDVTPATQAMCDTYMATGQVDVIQVVYSILRQQNLSVIEKADKNGTGVIVRSVLESGLLTGAYKPGHVFPSTDHRSRYNRKNLDYILGSVEEIGANAIQPPYTSLPQAAMRFSMAPPGVSCIIMGAQKTEEVQMNLNTLDLPPLAPEMISQLQNRYGHLTEKANFA
ncbi:aldo/keto reductase [Chloroflexi bacterium TSY]|nr:aldo/keto reductase [Chloroflexi bacterium TSY]